MKKRLVSLLLAVSMMLMMLPVSAFADSGSSAAEKTIKLTNPIHYGDFDAYPDVSGLTDQDPSENSFLYVSPDGWEYSYTTKDDGYNPTRYDQELTLKNGFYGGIERADGKHLAYGISVYIEKGATLTGGDVYGSIYNHGTINAIGYRSDSSTYFSGVMGGTVHNYGTIQYGWFDGSILNSGWINGGLFTGRILGNGEITDGHFYAESFESNTIHNGHFTKPVPEANLAAGAVLYTIRFANGTSTFGDMSNLGWFGKLSKLYVVTDGVSTADVSITPYEAVVDVNGNTARTCNASKYGYVTQPDQILDLTLPTDADADNNVILNKTAKTAHSITFEDTYGGAAAKDADGNAISSAVENTRVYLTYDESKLPVDKMFKSWSGVTTAKDDIGTYFVMPDEDVTIKAVISSVNIDPDVPDDSGANPALVAAGVTAGTIAVGTAAYYFGTTAYLKSVLPEDASIPTTREELAVLLWTTAGKPEPETEPAYTDVADPDTAKAIRWCVENELMTCRDDTLGKPQRYVTRVQVILAWNTLQQLTQAR